VTYFELAGTVAVVWVVWHALGAVANFLKKYA
jgi:hypothetical protein